MPWSTKDDLLIGDLRVSAAVDAEAIVEDAALEMEAKLGLVYVLPLPGGLPTHILTTLKLINNRLASGRLIMQVAIGGEDHTLHKYGQSLVEMAYADLDRIMNGSIPIAGAERVDTNEADGPKIIQTDATSPLDVFNTFTSGTDYDAYSAQWSPG